MLAFEANSAIILEVLKVLLNTEIVTLTRQM